MNCNSPIVIEQSGFSGLMTSSNVFSGYGVIKVGGVNQASYGILATVVDSDGFKIKILDQSFDTIIPAIIQVWDDAGDKIDYEASCSLDASTGQVEYTLDDLIGAVSSGVYYQIIIPLPINISNYVDSTQKVEDSGSIELTSGTTTVSYNIIFDEAPLLASVKGFDDDGQNVIVKVDLDDVTSTGFTVYTDIDCTLNWHVISK